MARGVRLIFDRSAQVLASLERELEQVLEAGAQAIHDEAVSSIMSGAKTGRIYRRGGAVHQASASGEAPANDSQELADSIVIERPSPTRRRVVVGASYGAILELRKNRPFLLPAFYRSVPMMRARMRNLQRRGGWQPGRPLRRNLHYRSQVKVNGSGK